MPIFEVLVKRSLEDVAQRRPELLESIVEDDSEGEEVEAAPPGAAVSNLSRSMLNLYRTPPEGIDAMVAAGSVPPAPGSPTASGGHMEIKWADGSEELGAAAADLERDGGAGLGPGSSALQTKRSASGAAARGATPKKARTMAGRGTFLNASAPKPVFYADLGGIERVLSEIKQLVEYPLKHPEVYSWLGVQPPRGVLLHGPPGCGKTALANAIANECGVPFYRISAPELVSGMSGESEENIRQLFQKAAVSAPAIIFIDEIDAIAPKRESAQREMERRIVAQLLTSMDDLGTSAEAGAKDASGNGGDQALPSARHVIVIGATNRPDSIDTALRRAGRFDREIALNIPTESARLRILQVLTRRMRLGDSLSFEDIARRTPGFAGADLEALMKEAAALAVQRIFRLLEAETASEYDKEIGDASICPAVPGGKRLGQGPLSPEELRLLAISAADVDEAISKVQPSVRREGFSTTPDTTWEDVGALADIREELEFAVIKPIMYPSMFAAMGLHRGAGVLLFGPPGCGKTLVAKAAAHASGANFISIKGPELLNKYVGESERAVRQVFARARAAAPCVLFFDEMDALAPRRGGESNQSSERLVNQLLTEMDGVDQRASVFLIAATNRPDIIDPALLRPGRLDKILYVPLPDAPGRISILRALALPSKERMGVPLAPDVDLEALGSAAALEGYSGADLAALLQEASVLALKERFGTGMSVEALSAGQHPPLVCPAHFHTAMQRVRPSVSEKDHRRYQILRDRLRSARGHIKDEEGAGGESAAQP